MRLRPFPPWNPLSTGSRARDHRSIGMPVDDSQAPLRHRKLAGTVASFRTWRGSRRSLAQDPAISGGHDLAMDDLRRDSVRVPSYYIITAMQLQPHASKVVDDRGQNWISARRRLHLPPNNWHYGFIDAGSPENKQSCVGRADGRRRCGLLPAPRATTGAGVSLDRMLR